MAHLLVIPLWFSRKMSFVYDYLRNTAAMQPRFTPVKYVLAIEWPGSSCRSGDYRSAVCVYCLQFAWTVLLGNAVDQFKTVWGTSLYDLYGA